MLFARIAGKPHSAQEDPEVVTPQSAIRNPHWTEPIAVTLFFALLTLAMTWPWALYMGEAINPFGDVVVQMTSLRWNAHALTTNPLGLFEAPFFYPYAHSLAFSENLLGQTILALPILLLTGNAALANNFNILLSFVLTGLFTYLLVRDLTGSKLAGLFSGVAFAFCPFRFVQMGHLHMLATQWFPFTLWALHRWLGVRGQSNDSANNSQHSLLATRYSLLAGLGFVAMALSSVYYAYFLALAVGLYLLWWVLIEARGVQVVWGPLALKLAIWVAAVGAVLLPVFLPYLQSNQELGFSRSTYEVRNWEAEWSFYGNVLQSNWLYAQVLAPAMASPGGERQLFPGVVATLLALVGLVWGKGRTRFFFALLGLVALVLTFGLSGRIPITNIEVPLPYAFLYDWVPGFKALRVPVRFAVLLDLALYVLAGYGLAKLLQGSGVRDQGSVLGHIPVRRIVLAGLLMGLVLLEFANPLDTSNRSDVTAQLREIEPYGWLARPENAGPVLHLPMSADQSDVWYTFFATKHWQPVVNGWSSFVPPGTVHLKQALDAFPDAATISLLQGLEVRHVVVHLWQFPRDRQADLKSRLDATPELEMVNQAGDNYVYRLAPDPWVHDFAQETGDGSLWVGEGRRGSMPSLEVLAYYLLRWEVVTRERMGGNIDIGHRPIGSLPFGTAADYALVPSGGGVQSEPFGFEDYELVKANGAVHLLRRNSELLASYDMTAPDAPSSEGELNLGVGSSGVAFDSASPDEDAASRTVRLTFVAFSPSEATLRVGQSSETLRLPVGISTYTSAAFEVPGEMAYSQGGDMRLLRVDLLTAEGTGDGSLIPNRELMPVEVTPLRSGDTLDARLRVAAPAGGGDYTVTVDVYVEPWGTHPQGHFGAWSVVLPADGAGHDYAFSLDPLAKSVATTRDGQPLETFGWAGPPTEGDFRTTLTITREGQSLASAPLCLFTLKDGRLTDWQPDSPTLVVSAPGE